MHQMLMRSILARVTDSWPIRTPVDSPQKKTPTVSVKNCCSILSYERGRKPAATPSKLTTKPPARELRLVALLFRLQLLLINQCQGQSVPELQSCYQEVLSAPLNPLGQCGAVHLPSTGLSAGKANTGAEAEEAWGQPM
jgi:hypothetical protein